MDLPWWSHFSQRAKRLGLKGLLDYYIHESYESYSEWKLGIDSAEYVELSTLGLDNPQWQLHAPSDYRSLHKILRLVRPDSSRDVFIDYGCGLGRVVCLAATMPWRKIIGLEISPQLLEKARRNLERMRGRRCRDVQWVNADAAKYELDDDVTTIFLFNPFSGDVLRAVLDNIQESLRRRRRKVTVLYKNRSKLQELGSVPWLRPLGHFACHGTHDFAWYEAVAQGEKANEMSDSMR